MTAKLYIGGKQARADGGHSYSVTGKGGAVLGQAALANRKDVRNAVEAVETLAAPPPEPAITLSVADRGETVVIAVSDRGPGLDEAAVALREKPLVGPVRVGIPDEYSGTVLPRVLAAFDERHEGVQVSVRVDHSSAQIAALGEWLGETAPSAAAQGGHP